MQAKSLRMVNLLEQSEVPMPGVSIMSILVSLFLMISTVLHAQTGSASQEDQKNSFARIVVIEPHEGKRAEFEAGYKRHLEWHKANNDPWTWHGWSFVFGGRPGLFMDGTFGHAAADFDQAVAPGADAADNAKNVNPYADFVSHAVYERVELYSRGQLLPDPSPFLEMTTFDLYPGAEPEFERLVLHESKRASEGIFSWYRLVTGGPQPRYLLFRGRVNQREVVRSNSFFSDQKDLRNVVSDIQIEVLRYRPDMSYVPLTVRSGS